MGQFYGMEIPTQGLSAAFDVANPKCVDATSTITSSTRLKNLVNRNHELGFQDTASATLSAMSFVVDNGSYVYDQVSTAGGEPGWKATSTIPRSNDETFIGWYKFQNGSSYQRGDNIYGGGFSGRTSFYISPSGTSSSHGLLRYSDAGGTDSFSVTGSHGANDGNWHMLCGRDYGPDGAHTAEFWLDGVLTQSGTSNATHDTPDGNQTMTWGSWSGDYGNMGGRLNLFYYWNRTLTPEEILQFYNATKGRFGA
jgi:hypothetical protein